MDSDFGERHQRSPWPSAAFDFLTLPNHCCIMCLLYVLVSYCLPDIYIKSSFKLNIFRTSLVTMLWITLKHCGTFIVVWGMCWLSVDIQAKTTLLMCIRLLFTLPQNMTEDQKHKSSWFKWFYHTKIYAINSCQRRTGLLTHKEQWPNFNFKEKIRQHETYRNLK